MDARLSLSARVLLGIAVVVWPALARAGSIDPAVPQAVGRVITAGPAPLGPSLLAAGGYGYTGSILGMDDAHHRVAGSLALDDRLLPWLDLALRLDGRYDAHVTPGQPTDTGLVGDPRLYARVDRAWVNGLRLGARAGLWLPGRNAPSVDADALSPELLGVASYVARTLPVAVTANVGFRLDRSGRSAPDAAMLGPGDRSALEVSAFNEVLAGLAVTATRGRAQGFLEASAELLTGSGAPPLKASPMFVGGGARWAVAPALRLEAEAEVSPSSRPGVGASAPLVPIPPRFAFWLGLAYRFGGAKPAPPPPPPAAPPIVTPPPAVPLAAPAPDPAEAPAAEPHAPGGQIRGLVRSMKGTALTADIAVEPEGVAPSPGAASQAQRIHAESGQFQIDVPPGRYHVTIEAPGHATQVRTVDVEDNGVTVLNVDLRTER